ncbi:hypothetical protein [Bacteriovorax sp. Seq25_V]|uniref:hypothetical protein n=1 Tax=Bacteriovorax sp. Seq25_V TaxID=1201288 RepID=UPI00038A0347|nr:hypothetical protein [Bacteriovorax sp. Seq25_V]EQC48029.1 hypothetical protein M900_1127 [Bacteriovorax sp. Seq25_V]
MKSLLITLLIASNMSSFAIGGSLLRNFTKPFAKIGIGSTSEKSVNKVKHIRKFLNASDLRKSELDKVEIKTVLPHFPGSVLESNYEKITELEDLGYELRNSIVEFLERGKVKNDAEVLLLARQIEDFNFLLASVTVSLVKEPNIADVKEVINIISDITKHIPDMKVNGSYLIVSAFMDFQDVLTKSAKNITKGLGK